MSGKSASNGDETRPLIDVEDGVSSRASRSEHTPGQKADPGAKVRAGLSHSPNAAEEKANARIDRAEMQHALEAMPQAAVSEAELHKTPWNVLGWEFLLNIVPSLLMASAATVVLRFTPPLPFKLKYVLVPIAFTVVFGLMVLLVDLAVATARNTHKSCLCGRRMFAESPLLQAIFGRRILTLETASEVFIFAHALERKAGTPGAFVGLVANPQDAAAMQKILTVGNTEMLPGNWKATAFYSDARDYSAELRAGSEKDLYPSPSQVVERWLFKEKDSFKVPCFVELRPANTSVRLVFLWRHWAVRVVFSAVILFIVITPIMTYVGTMHRLKHMYCDKNMTEALPFCVADKDGKTCHDYCDHLIDFMGEVGSRIGVEEIEIIWTVCLAIVFVYSLCIIYVRGCHEPTETKFVLGTGGITKAAMAEVMQVGRLLNDSLSIVAIISALGRQRQAYFATLRSCQPLIGDYFKSQNALCNPCLHEVLKPVKDMLSGKATPWPLHLNISVEEHYEKDINGETKELEPWITKMSTATQDLCWLKNTLGLTRQQSLSRKDCMFSVSVPITCREALEVMRHWMFDKSGPHGYADQINTIFSMPDCQDRAPQGEGTGAYCHVIEDFRVGPLFIPAGVCLTHICCETADMSLLTLQVGMNKDIGSKEVLRLLFHGKEASELNNSLALEDYHSRFRWPPILLPSAAVPAGAKGSNNDDEETSCVSSDMLAAKLKDTYIYKFYFVFQLSPTYLNSEALAMAEQGDVSLYGFVEGTFTRLARSPVPHTELVGSLSGHAEALKQQSWKDTACSEFCLVAEEEKLTIHNKIVGLCASLSVVFGLTFLCVFFAMIVPIFRHFKWGGAFFPDPFTNILIFNAFQQFLALFVFLYIFTRVSMRLALVSDALSTFEQRSLAPCFSDSAQPLSKDRLDRETEPFRLYVNQTQDYDPSDERWAKAFRHKERNLMNWHRTACWLRLFVSGSRFTAQAVLVGAAGILLIMFLVDVSQALRGTGAFSVNEQTFLDYARSRTVGKVTGMVSDGVNQAADVANGLVTGGAVATAKAATSRRLLESNPDSGDLSGAAQALAAALAPIEEAVERVRQRQLFELSTAMTRASKLVNVGDVQKISQAQILTIFTAVLLLVYSCFLLGKIAFINDHVDKHESILIQVKEQHLQKQSIRDRQAADLKAKKLLKDESTDITDQAQTSYNKTLDMVIESAHANRSRFPLALFSFIITQGLLMAWVCAAVQPLVQQLTQVVPSLAVQGCQWIASSGVVSSVEHQVTQGMEAAFHEESGSENGILYSLVCTPLLEATKAKTAGWEKAVEQGKDVTAERTTGATADATADATQRRLAEVDRDLLLNTPRSIVEAWWDANPGDPDAKLALVQMMLAERARTARKLLVAGPEAVLKALETGSLEGSPRERTSSGWPRSWLGPLRRASPVNSPGEL